MIQIDDMGKFLGHKTSAPARDVCPIHIPQISLGPNVILALITSYLLLLRLANWSASFISLYVISQE